MSCASSYTPETSGVLSEDDYIWCFKIAGVIWDAVSTASIHDGFGVQLSLTDLAQLQTDLRARLASFDSQTVIHIQDCISKWVPIQFSTTEMDAGAVGDTSGLKYSAAKKRDLISKVFSGITGCMSMANSLMWKKTAVQGAGSDDCVIGVRRG